MKKSLLTFVGTYRKPCQSWIQNRRLYNIPVAGNVQVALEQYAACTHLWLIAPDEEDLHYALKNPRLISLEDLRALGYPCSKTPHAEMYVLFDLVEMKFNPKTPSSFVFIIEDYAKSKAKVKLINDFLRAKVEKATFEKTSEIEKILPAPIVSAPSKKVMVSTGVQMHFLEQLFVMKKHQTEKDSITVASLFSGCGGMDLGIIGGFDFLGKHYGKTNFEIVWANELNPNACRTYRENFGECVVQGDVSEKIKTLPKSVDVVVGGFPCQDISINGKMLGIAGKRSCLYTYIVEAVKKTKPKVFIAENVGGLLLKQNEFSLKKIISDFNELGYNLHYQLYHAEDYGVPQTRERVIFVGTRRDLPKYNPPEVVTKKPITAYMALHDLEDHPFDKEFSHIWSVAKASGEQGNRHLLANRPGYTMRAECHGNIQFHYSLPRRISMREAARIQSFPDTFKFPCGLRETERQIGNAVPPVLAWHIATAVKKILSK